MKNLCRYIYLSLLAVLVLWMLLCTHIAGVVSVKEILSRIAIPVIVFMISATLFTRFGDKARSCLFILLAVFTLFECGEGILQLLGKVKSKNPYYILTGNFVNQGLFGGMMSLFCTVCLVEFFRLKDKKWRIAVSALFIIPFVMMIVSVSRAAWLGFVIASAVIVYRETSFRFNFKSRIAVITIVAASIAACTAIFFIKPESALARLHIWRMDSIAIMQHPLTGVGSGAEVGAYAAAQEHFFSSSQRPVSIKQLADSPQFAFNEFVKFGMQGGIPGLVLSIAIYCLSLVILGRKRSFLLYPAIAFGVFSFFSFPLHSTSLSSLLALFLADAAAGQRRSSLPWLVASCVVVVCASNYAVLHVNDYKCIKKFGSQTTQSGQPIRFGRYWPALKYYTEYASYYALRLYYKGCYSEALEILDQCSPFTANSSYYCLIGQCREGLGDIQGSLASYKKAMNMVPSRYMPYYLIINCYKKLGMEPLAALYRDKALSIPCDTTQSESVRIRKQIEDITFEEPEQQHLE